MKLLKFSPELAVLTNSVTSHTLMWPEYEYELCRSGYVPPLVVAPVSRNLARAFLILDGNHRACLCAKHGRLVPAYVMTRKTRPKEILELESAEEIRPFPHRLFLFHEQTYGALIREGIEAAIELNETVDDMLCRLRRTE
ncbi:MAG TPA: hypothetical protein PLU91_20005 [Verrucomicrobiota bacterium]|jgi:hypothetical protein|nr:hypothetical protein [Verrucomicrobiota bacterium]